MNKIFNNKILSRVYARRKKRRFILSVTTFLFKKEQKMEHERNPARLFFRFTSVGIFIQRLQ